MIRPLLRYTIIWPLVAVSTILGCIIEGGIVCWFDPFTWRVADDLCRIATGEKKS